MNLTQLIDAVYTETNRPDLVPETLQAVLEATLSLHTVDSFYKDIKSAVIIFDNPRSFVQQIDTSVLPHYRSMAYVQKMNPNFIGYEYQNQGAQRQYASATQLINGAESYPGAHSGRLKRIDIGEFIDSYGYEKIDVWYQAGKQLNIKSCTQLSHAYLGWYAYPEVDISGSGANFSSWIADELPYTIVYKAAAGVFAKIGEDKSWAIYAKAPIPGQGEETGGLYYQQLAQLRRMNIVAEG